jgi:hypothetical protein
MEILKLLFTVSGPLAVISFIFIASYLVHNDLCTWVEMHTALLWPKLLSS